MIVYMQQYKILLCVVWNEYQVDFIKMNDKKLCNYYKIYTKTKILFFFYRINTNKQMYTFDNTVHSKIIEMKNIYETCRYYKQTN